MPGNSHGRRSLAGYSPWGHKESDTTEHACRRVIYRVNKTFHTVHGKNTEVDWFQTGKDLFKKIKDTKGTFHAKTGSIKDRNGMDLTEPEDIQKRWQE